MSSQNIRFLGFVEDDQLVREISNCIAVIFPSDIEYSLVPIEANSLGKPVVAYDSESSRELLIDAEENHERGTAIFYKERTSGDVKVALEKASTYVWNTQVLMENAKRFDPDLFRSRLHSIVESQ
jgi:glycosyltransferase involved in cell wall biosynthesis